LTSFLCDSGANVSIINGKIIQKLLNDSKSEILPVSKMLCTVTGENKAFLGKTIIQISLGGYFLSMLC
jgi:hypothetical protein